MNLLLCLHAFSCWFMTGVIWLVQLLVYPIFKRVGENEFHQIHQFHKKQITWIVAPVMTLELITGVWLFYMSEDQFFFWNLITVVSLWALTAFVNVPTHNRLSYISDASKTDLVNRNWPRTLIWTLRSVLLIFFIFSQSTRGVV